MGNAFHRKQIPISRGSKTRGTGIRYVNTTPTSVRTLTADELAVREQQKAAFQAQRGLRDWNVHCLMTIAGFALDAWEDAILEQKSADRDYATERIVDKALAVVNSVVTKHCDKSGIEIERLVQALHRTHHSAELQSALSVVSKRFSLVFQQLQ
jgi:hypothetical protein